LWRLVNCLPLGFGGARRGVTRSVVVGLCRAMRGWAILGKGSASALLFHAYTRPIRGIVCQPLTKRCCPCPTAPTTPVQRGGENAKNASTMTATNAKAAELPAINLSNWAGPRFKCITRTQAHRTSRTHRLAMSKFQTF
jgi:hypothetical protein